MCSLLQGALEAGGRLDLVGGLGEQLAPVGQHQHPLPGADAVLGDGGEHHRLAGAGGQHQQGAAVSGDPLGVHRLPGLLLVRPQFHQKAPFCQESCCAAGAAGAAGSVCATGGRNLVIRLVVPVSPAWGPLRLV